MSELEYLKSLYQYYDLANMTFEEYKEINKNNTKEQLLEYLYKSIQYSIKDMKQIEEYRNMVNHTIKLLDEYINEKQEQNKQLAELEELEW